MFLIIKLCFSCHFKTVQQVRKEKMLILNQLHRFFSQSGSVRGRHASPQWVVLLFNVFLDCSADETLEKYISKKFQ